jgi:hypothetical protein
MSLWSDFLTNATGLRGLAAPAAISTTWVGLFDLGAIAAWHLNAMDRAVEWGQEALELASDDQRPRLRINLVFLSAEEMSKGRLIALPDASGDHLIARYLARDLTLLTLSPVFVNPHRVAPE